MLTLGTADVTTEQAATQVASAAVFKLSNYPVCDPAKPDSHMWGARSNLALPKKDTNSFPGANLLCMTGEDLALCRAGCALCMPQCHTVTYITQAHLDIHSSRPIHTEVHAYRTGLHPVVTKGLPASLTRLHVPISTVWGALC